MKENSIREYEKKSRRYILYMLIGTVLFLCFSIVGIEILDINKLKRTTFIQDINTINVLLGLIAIPCCLLYYYMYKNNEFFILKLSYISIFIEYIFVNFIIENIGLSAHLITFPFVVRIFLLTIAILNESKYAYKIVSRKKLSVILIILINIIGTFMEVKLNLSNIFSIKSIYLWNIIQCSLLIYYVILLLSLVKRCIRKNEFIYTIFITTISIFTIRRIFYLNIFSKYAEKVLVYNSFLSTIAYLILLVGLYVEVVRRIEVSNKLNNQVNNLKDFQKKYNEIKGIEKAKTQFFANLSHEIKTPINIIYSCFQLLEISKSQGENALWKAYCKYDGTIKQNCFRFISLVEDITLSIIPYVEAKNINVLFDTYVEELIIKCDPESIERVILNLLSNSVKFTDDNGNISVLMDADDEFVTIRVKDDGSGISKGVSEHIFERFVQEDKSFNRKKEGSGIGLSLVKSLIELHEGTVSLEKEVEKGCEIVIKLPNVRMEEDNDNNSRIIDAENKPLVQKINIEFSDIYELY